MDRKNPLYFKVFKEDFFFHSFSLLDQPTLITKATYSFPSYFPVSHKRIFQSSFDLSDTKVD